MNALSFSKGADKGRYIAVTDDLTYLVVNHHGKWWLSIYSTQTMKDVETTEPHDSRTLAYAVASAYAANVDDYSPADHGGKNLMTVATLIGYDS